MDSNTDLADGCWNQPYTLSSGQTQAHELSHTRLWVTLLDKEWQIRTENAPADVDRVRWTEQISHVVPGSDTKLQRFIRPDEGFDVAYMPVLPDRPTVIKPYQPLTIPAAGECTIYVGVLVWMRILAGHTRTQLVELPLADPQMTWVGSSTMDGELCYTAPSYARLVLEAVPKRPWRAVAPVRICNRRDKPLLLERFSLPTQLLCLYQNEKGQLWTPKVTVVCETELSEASLKVDTDVIAEAGTCKRITDARVKPERGGFSKAIDKLFG